MHSDTQTKWLNTGACTGRRKDRGGHPSGFSLVETIDGCPPGFPRLLMRLAPILAIVLALTTLATPALAVIGDTPQPGPTFTVNTTDDVDDGMCGVVHCSLREAINAANAHANGGSPDQIVFNIPGSGPFTIQPATPLPTITDPVIIDGTTQPGASCAAWPPTLLIEL
ncbi:MAG: CSLREA domain-containing protein, partial [Caldilineae bacterium]